MVITDKDVDFSRYLPVFGERESQVIKDPADFVGKVCDICEHGETQMGTPLPWSKTEEVQRIRPGELSIWGGINGHGKSLLLGQVILNLMKNEKAIIASLEMKPEQTLYRMACQYAGCRPSKDFAFETMGKFQDRLWVYDQLDTVEKDRILGMVYWASQELGINHIVIDSLIKCGIGRENYEAQEKFVDRLQWCAKAYNVHIHLVCHMRKTDKEESRPGKYDVRGAAEIVDLADNLFIIHRNKIKEQEKNKMEAGKQFDESKLET